MEQTKPLYNKRSKSLSYLLLQTKNPFMLFRWSQFFILELAADKAFLDPSLHNSANFLFKDFSLKIIQTLEKYRETVPNDVPAFYETYRSNNRQFLLFKEGKSKIKSYGMHFYGIAVDVVNFKNNLIRWNLDYNTLLKYSRANGLTDLEPYEQCHLQFIPVDKQNDWRAFARNLTICVQDLLNVKTDGIIGAITQGQILINYNRLEYYFHETEKELRRKDKDA